MNTNMTGFRKFSKKMRSGALDASSLSIGRVKISTFVSDPARIWVNPVMLEIHRLKMYSF